MTVARARIARLQAFFEDEEALRIVTIAFLSGAIISFGDCTGGRFGLNATSTYGPPVGTEYD